MIREVSEVNSCDFVSPFSDFSHHIILLTDQAGQCCAGASPICSRLELSFFSKMENGIEESITFFFKNFEYDYFVAFAYIRASNNVESGNKLFISRLNFVDRSGCC